ncbi:hypothetical protein LINPERHAP1_LOCUS32500, partial [Linum perenne]
LSPSLFIYFAFYLLRDFVIFWCWTAARPTRRRRRDAGVVTARQHRPKKTLKHKVYKWRKEIKEA